MRDRKHSVRQGECTESLAMRFGHVWETIWDHPENRRLKSDRDNPNVLLPGDEILVPEARPKNEAGETRDTHRFIRKGVPSSIRIRLIEDDQPLKDEEYTLVIDGKKYTGSTDSEGWLEQPIPPGAKKGQLFVGDHRDEYSIMLGHLDPPGEISGMQSRLNNLGYYCGREDGVLGEQTQSAMRAFQRDNDLTVSGAPDAALWDALIRIHGS